jgi:dihydroneopterin aldolase
MFEKIPAESEVYVLDIRYHCQRVLGQKDIRSTLGYAELSEGWSAHFTGKAPMVR